MDSSDNKKEPSLLSNKVFEGLLSSLSHRLATHLATLQFKQQGTKKVTAELINGYEAAVNNKLIENKISEKLFSRLGEMQNLDEQILPMLDMLNKASNFLHTILHSNEVQGDKDSVNAHLLIKQVLENFPFKDCVDSKKVTFNPDSDFLIQVPRVFIESSLCHLLRLIGSNLGEEHINLWLSSYEFQNVIHIQVMKQFIELPSIFQHFLFEPYDTNLPGLGLCRYALMQWGGDILSLRENEKGTHFKIIIPH